MTDYNDNARGALDIETATKSQLNEALLSPMSASALKKMNKADLVALVNAQDATPTPDQMQRDESNHWGVLDDSEALTPTTPEKPAPKARKAKAAPASKTDRKPGADVILFLPADSQKEPKAGTKRAAIIDLLRAPKGATVDDIAAATGWSRSVAQSALYVDVKGSGWGVERKEGRLHLLPQDAK
jgi:Protein of unknown function (DUF3489)